MTDVVFQREMLPLGEFLKINLDIREREITAFIGPSGCGKSTCLICRDACNGYQNE